MFLFTLTLPKEHRVFLHAVDPILRCRMRDWMLENGPELVLFSELIYTGSLAYYSVFTSGGVFLSSASVMKQWNLLLKHEKLLDDYYEKFGDYSPFSVDMMELSRKLRKNYPNDIQPVKDSELPF